MTPSGHGARVEHRRIDVDADDAIAGCSERRGDPAGADASSRIGPPVRRASAS
jgi:hypothetical protein